MTNLQLLLTIGIPSLLIVLSWITNNSRFDRIEKRLDQHDIRFNELQRDFNERLLGLQPQFNTRFGELQSQFNTRMNSMESSLHRDTLEILRSMTALHERVAVVETRQSS